MKLGWKITFVNLLLRLCIIPIYYTSRVTVYANITFPHNRSLNLDTSTPFYLCHPRWTVSHFSYALVASLTSKSGLNLWPTRCFMPGPNRFLLLGIRSGLYDEWFITFQPNFCSHYTCDESNCDLPSYFVHGAVDADMIFADFRNGIYCSHCQNARILFRLPYALLCISSVKWLSYWDLQISLENFSVKLIFENVLPIFIYLPTNRHL